ncbi:MAG TPA: serine/threonine-protein kinase [Candidatus Obscuribacter sp.]|nr:serine/threonine-protein kinase [Candidatus Obscuribacter sp.]
MAELCIKVHYQDPVRDGIVTTFKLLFPFWGILPFVFALMGLSMGLVSLGAALTHVMLWLLIPLLSLIFLRLISSHQILMDKRGIEIPGDFTQGIVKSRYIPWAEVSKVFVSGDNQKTVVLMTSKDNLAVKLPASRMDVAELEKLLVTIDLLLEKGKDESLKELALTLKQNKDENLGLSYTDIWEDELKRRFRPASFMPLEKDVLVRNGSLKIVRPLASGGLSAVYLASTQSGSLVVLKESVIPEGFDSQLQEKAREMFAREAKILMQLSCDSIVKVLDYFTEGGRSYLMLESVTGPDLRQYVKQHGKVRESLVLDLGLQMAEILCFLHAQNPPVIHRDFTPDNLVLQNDGKLIAIDFGAANEFIGTATGTFVGKHAYIAPEQFRGKATPQSDLYAMGGTLFYLLTGEEPEALSASDPAVKVPVSSQWSSLILDMTNPDAAARVTTAEVVKARLTLIKEGDAAKMH